MGTCPPQGRALARTTTLMEAPPPVEWGFVAGMRQECKLVLDCKECNMRVNRPTCSVQQKNMQCGRGRGEGRGRGGGGRGEKGGGGRGVGTGQKRCGKHQDQLPLLAKCASISSIHSCTFLDGGFLRKGTKMWVTHRRITEVSILAYFGCPSAQLRLA